MMDRRGHAMPMHDWTRVTPNQYHDFHLNWIAAIRTALNSGLMPPEYYAAAEQRVYPYTPDVLTLKLHSPSARNGSNGFHDPTANGGGVAVLTTPARHTVMDEGEAISVEEPLQRIVAIRHNSNDDLVAVIELVSPANKDSESSLNEFTRKSESLLKRGVHLLVIDPFPPDADAHGMHDAIWGRVVGKTFRPPAGTPLTLASYRAKSRIEFVCFVEPLAVGDALPEMPLYLTRTAYINVPLERTYLAAWEGYPRPWKDELTRPFS